MSVQIGPAEFVAVHPATGVAVCYTLEEDVCPVEDAVHEPTRCAAVVSNHALRLVGGAPARRAGHRPAEAPGDSSRGQHGDLAP